MKAIALLLPLLAAGCAYGAPSPTDGPMTPAAVQPSLDFEGGWSDDERAAIVAGFAEWPAAPLAPLAVYRIVAGAPTPAACPSEGEASGYFAVDEGTRAVCFYADTFESPDNHALALFTLQRVAAHEMGHALGLDHYAGAQPSIMTATLADSALTVQPEDLDALALAQKETP